MSSQVSPNYTQTTFGQIAKKLVNGGTPPTEIAQFWNGKIPWITGADFTTNGIGEFRRFVSETAIAQTATNLIDQGQLLLVTRTGVGKLAIAPCDIAISQDITGVYPDTEKVDVRFLYHRMRLGVEELKKLNQGTSINGIIRSDLFAYPIQLPALPQQRRIAEILSTLDEAIEQTEALIAKHQQIKAGLMHDLFTRGVTPDGRLRPTREQAPGLYKESPLGWIPKEWDTATLSERGRSGRPHLKTGPFGSSLKIEHWVEQGHPVITIGALGEGEFIQPELLFVGNATAQRLLEYQLEVGDVVFSRVADVGRSAVILGQHKGWIMSSNLMRISLDQTKVRAAYLQSQLAHDSRVRAQIRATVNAGGRDVANSQILNRLLFAWPQPDEQTRILDRVEALDGKRQAETSYLNNLIKLKHGLMHDLLTGRVQVNSAPVSFVSAVR